VSVKIHVEGGGGQSIINTQCRKGFSEYFAKIVPDGRKPKIVPSGSRKSAYDDFCTSVETERNKYELILLLVDSEDAVAGGRTSWQHLKARAADKWDKPEQADDRSAHLMVQCMESWFLADKDTLEAYFGEGFLKKSLPGNTDVEQIAKKDVLAALEHAVRPTTKEHYHKTAHGYELLGLIDPEKVGAASQHAKALNDLMAAA
jgi:Domain of unknown function (DUF4276)